MGQLADHAEAFHAARTTLGGKAQHRPDPVLPNVVNSATPKLTGPAPVVALARPCPKRRHRLSRSRTNQLNPAATSSNTSAAWLINAR